MRHWMLLLLSILFSWVVWCVVNYPVFRQLRGWALVRELLIDFGEQIVETIILLELSLLYIRVIVYLFWNKKRTLSNIIIQVIILAFLNGISSIGCAMVYYHFYPAHEEIFAKVAYTDYLSLSVLTTAYLVIFLMNRYRDEENAVLQAQLKSLSLQTDNHFVFNSFSTLSGLIKTEPEKAEGFLQDLSKVYRYLVMNGTKNVVPLKEELSFVNDYAHLMEVRYSGVFVSIDNALFCLDAYICPASLQGLVENAVKHNRHGKDSNLRIDITRDNDWICITNNLLPREDETRGANSGLSNLKERYFLLADKLVNVIATEKEFKVMIPILYLEDLKDESFNC